MSDLEDTLIFQLHALGAPEPAREWIFHPIRRWRFDLAWPERLFAVEVEGGVYTGGRHVTGKGYENDLVKLNTATLMGWKVLRYTAKTSKSGEAAQEIMEALND